MAATVSIANHFKYPPIEEAHFPDADIALILAEKPNGANAEISVIGCEGRTGAPIVLGNMRTAIADSTLYIKLVTPERTINHVAEQELLIVRQQELVGRLFRTPGQQHQSRGARAKLMFMLNRLDVMQDMSDPNSGAPLPMPCR